MSIRVIGREGKFKGLIVDALHSLKTAQCKSYADTTPEHQTSMFDNKVKKDNSVHQLIQ